MHFIPFDLVIYLNFNIIEDDTTDEPYTSSYTGICRYWDIGTNLFHHSRKVNSYKYEIQLDGKKQNYLYTPLINKVGSICF